MREKGLKFFVTVIFCLFVLVLAGCESMGTGLFGVSGDGGMQKYAEARYLKGLRYMRESRFELAQEQFAIAAATAVSPELQNLARTGYAKVDLALAVKR